MRRFPPVHSGLKHLAAVRPPSQQSTGGRHLLITLIVQLFDVQHDGRLGVTERRADLSASDENVLLNSMVTTA